MKLIYLVLLTGSIWLSIKSNAQNVGIGTTTPNAGLHIVNNNGIVARGTINSGAVINETGTGSLFIFNPRKGGAIRAGFLSNTGQNYWNDASTGEYSIGLGLDAKALASGSTAIGQNTSANGVNSTAIGFSCSALMPNAIVLSGAGSHAKAPYSVAIGTDAFANTYGSVALGININAGSSTGSQNAFAIGMGDNPGFISGGHYASGTRSFAIGNNNQSLGKRSFAIGNDCESGAFFVNDTKGEYSFALGNACKATGNYSFAFGNNANTNLRIGSMVFGSRVDGVAVVSPADFYFVAQFAGGYQMQTNNAGTLGVFLNANSTSWGSLCDSTKKEQVLPLNDDETLEKLAAINYSSWKYKDDPDATNRHYGIMAQEFYAAFGKDALGNIGNDTIVNPIDLLGIAYSAIKALEKRTAEIEGLKTENDLLKARLEKLEALVTRNNKL